jgi:hypothetical protein
MTSRSTLLLEGCETERGEPGKVAQVDFLIPGLEEQAENFRPGLGKEIGERAHCSLSMNDCLPEGTKFDELQELGAMVQSIEATHSPTTTISGDYYLNALTNSGGAFLASFRDAPACGRAPGVSLCSTPGYCLISLRDEIMQMP